MNQYANCKKGHKKSLSSFRIRLIFYLSFINYHLMSRKALVNAFVNEELHIFFLQEEY